MGSKLDGEAGEANRSARLGRDSGGDELLPVDAGANGIVIVFVELPSGSLLDGLPRPDKEPDPGPLSDGLPRPTWEPGWSGTLPSCEDLSPKDAVASEGAAKVSIKSLAAISRLRLIT